MAELIVKHKSEYKNVLKQEDNIIENIDLTNVEQIDFTTSYKLEDNEWFKITDFSNQDYVVEICNENFSTASLVQIVNKEYEDIKEIEMLHREATQEEVNTFMEYDFISTLNFDSKRVGVQNRKRIADIGVKYANLSSEKQKGLITYAKEKSGIDIEDGKFLIRNDNDLKNLLYAMDQRYYYADIYEENRIANSIRIV